MRVSRLCTCGRIVTGDCEICTAQPKARAEDYRPSKTDQGRDWKWYQLSRRYRKQHPLCERCLQFDRTTPATEVHHKVPIRQDPSLRLNWDNLMAVCRQCHEIEERETVSK